MRVSIRARCAAVFFAALISVAALQALSQSVMPAQHLFTIDASKMGAAPVMDYLEMGSDSAGKSPDGSSLCVNNRYLELDGTPWLPVMGEFHFSRCQREHWEEEILKMKAGGVDIVAAYVIWIHHEEVEGTFDWTGQKDLRAFVKLCARHGLFVFPRIGPWAHGEVRNGGFPDWLLAKGPTRVIDSTFLFHVGRFYDEIGKQLKGLFWKDGGPVIGVQIENEYANRAPNGGDAYLLQLKKMAIRAGFDVPLYTVTGWDHAVVPPHAFVPVYGGYPDEAWSGSTSELRPDPQGVFQFHTATPVGTAGILQGTVTAAGELEHSHYPRFTAELGGGMENTYHRRVVVSPDDIASMALTSLGSGVNLLGYYMFHGGTNPEGKLTTLQESQATDYPNDVPIKSYDFQAPLGEFGQINGAFRKLKIIHQFVHDFGSELATMGALSPDVAPSGPGDTTTLRVSARTNGDRGFLFFNNYVRNYPLPDQQGVQVRLVLPSETIVVPSKSVNIPSQSWFFWPVNLEMGGSVLRYATAQPLAEISDLNESYYSFVVSPGVKPEFVFDASTVNSVCSKSGTILRKDGRIEVSGIAPSRTDVIRFQTVAGKQIHVVLLSRADAEDAWKLRICGREHMLISHADVFVNGETIHLRSREPQSLRLAVFPALDRKTESNVPLSVADSSGLFAGYVASVKTMKFTADLKRVREAGEVPPVKMGKFIDWRKCAVATPPDDSTFDKAATWRLTLPKSIPAGLSNLFLDINYSGDIARLYDGKRMLDDNFFNGTTWEVGLKRIVSGDSAEELELSILPLRKDAPIYIPKTKWPSFETATQVGRLNSLVLSPEYEVTLSMGRKSVARLAKPLLGADISFVATPGEGEYAPKPVYQEDGKRSNELAILKKHGWKAFRLRVFVSPVREAPDNSLEKMIPLAKAIKDSGSLFLLDLHFSDTWADPQHQDIPVAWRGLDLDAIEQCVEAHAHNVVMRLKKSGAMPDWVQIGNEITRGTLWPIAQVKVPGSTQYNPPEPYDDARQWEHLIRIIKAGIRGVKSAAGKTSPRIAIHIDKGANWPVTQWFFDHLEAAHVDYDIIAQSFYPPWGHGTLEGLRTNMLHCANRYGKDFLVAETGYGASQVGGNRNMLWPVTPEGRAQFMADVEQTVSAAPCGIGVMYWAPENDAWNADGTPGPTVFVLDSFDVLTKSPASHAPAAISQ